MKVKKRAYFCFWSDSKFRLVLLGEGEGLVGEAEEAGELPGEGDAAGELPGEGDVAGDEPGEVPGDGELTGSGEIETVGEVRGELLLPGGIWPATPSLLVPQAPSIRPAVKTASARPGIFIIA